MRWGVERMTCATTGRAGSRGVVAGGGGKVGGRRRAREGGVASAMAQKGQDGWAGSMASLVVVVDEGIGGVEARWHGSGRALGVEKSLYELVVVSEGPGRQAVGSSDTLSYGR